jgi:sulfofructose kinase
MLTFVGAATLDALALVDHYPAADERVVAAAISYAGGGPAATAAVVAARQGHDVAFVGAVGDDPEGHQIIAGLQAEGVQTDGVVVVGGSRSGASVVVVATESSTRAICNRPLPVADLTARPLVMELLAASTWIHVDHIGWAPTMLAIGHFADPPLTSYDGGHQVTGFTAEGLNLYAPTIEALEIRYGAADPQKLLTAAQGESGGTVVASHGAAGSWALDNTGELIHVPTFPIDVISTLGAGDVFHGALVAALADNHSLPDAVLRANATAALSCRGLDGRSAVPTLGELDTFLTDHRTDLSSPSNPGQE